MQTIQNFIKKYGVTVKFVQGNTRPDAEEWDSAAKHYRATIKREGKRYTCWYSQGSGIKDEPEAADLLDCLSSDASLGQNDFDDFCSELGYDTDSRDAHRQWLACRRAHNALERVLGYGALQSLMYDTERL